MAPYVVQLNSTSHSFSWFVDDTAPNSVMTTMMMHKGEAIESEEQLPFFSGTTDDYSIDPVLFDYGLVPSVDDLLFNLKDSEHIIPQQFSSGTPEERWRQVLENYKNDNSTKAHHILAQLWVSVPIEGDLVLRHSGHFAFGPWINNDEMKKKVSKRYFYDSLRKVFVIGVTEYEEDIPVLSNLDVGSILVNRCVAYKAFQLQSVQWAPNIHIYPTSSDHYTIFGTLALPVFDCHTNNCAGVFELVIDRPYIDYLAEIQDICKRLQEVNLRADTKLVNQPQQMVLLEIMNLMENASKIHNLPLAQIWLPCKCCGSDQNSKSMRICMSSAEIPFILMDSSLFPFWKTSSMYHMCEGQGVAGRAFLSKGSCFCNDITQFSDQNFPLVRTSREFGVCSSLAICLKSTNTGDDIYIVQFFIGNSLTSVKEQKYVVESIVKSMAQNDGSLKLASSEFEEIDAKLGKITKRKWLSNVVSSSETCGVGHLSPLVELNDDKDVGSKKERKKTRKLVLSRENLIRFLERTKEDAATELRVSISTIKRWPKDLKFKNWSDAQKHYGLPPTKRKRKAVDCDEPSSSSGKLKKIKNK